MRTTKRNIIELGPGETIEVRHGPAAIVINVNPDRAVDTEMAEFEVEVPAGMGLSGFRAGLSKEDVLIGFEGGEMLDEIYSPFDFIVFGAGRYSSSRVGGGCPIHGTGALDLDEDRNMYVCTLCNYTEPNIN